MSISSRATLYAAIGLSTFALAAPSTAPAAVINFDGRQHGEIVTDYYLRDKGVLISAKNLQGGPDIAIAFDTTRTQTNDRDLEDPWQMGNLVGETPNFKALILAENDDDSDGNGLIDRPDDQGSQPHLGSAGQITLDFLLPQQSLGLWI
ncbi:MAG: hypothetical protein M3478_15135 [Planctomycetota bacterium]|nr:hypothetical protein [Planctomycetota bacterium]